MLIRINKQTIYLGIIIFLLSFLSISKLFKSKGFLETASSYILYPIIKTQNKVSETIEIYRSRNESIKKLKEQVTELQKEKDNLIYDNVRLKSALGYLEQVSELIEFKRKINVDSIKSAQIIYKEISQNQQFAFIDKGSNESIEKDMVAIYKNCLIGKVSEVYPTYSKIIYITDNTCKISAYCYKTGSVGIYQGINNINQASLNYVNHLQDIEVDDLVLSSGDGLVFPQGFAIGKISSFKKDQIQYSIQVEPLIKLDKIKYCQLIKK